MPSKPVPDLRKNVELSEDEIQNAIEARLHKAKHDRNQAIGGYVVGFAGLLFAFVTALLLDNTMMATLGFVMSLIGFGLASIKQVAEIVRSIRGAASYPE